MDPSNPVHIKKPYSPDYIDNHQGQGLRIISQSQCRPYLKVRIFDLQNVICKGGRYELVYVYIYSDEGVEIYLLMSSLKVRLYLKVPKYAPQISVLKLNVDFNPCPAE